MRQLLPVCDPPLTERPLAAVYEQAPVGDWLAIGMVTSVDGAVAVDGTSRRLGGEGDLAGFRAVRSHADVVLVGARTAMAEGYRTTWAPSDAEGRRARSQSDLPRLAIATSSGALSADAPAFESAEHPPIVLTTPRGADRLAPQLHERAEVLVVEASAGALDLAAAVAALRERGMPRIVCEGGPTLNAVLLDAELVDELFVTIAPQLVGAAAAGVAGQIAIGRDLELRELWLHGSELLARYGLVTAEAGRGTA